MTTKEFKQIMKESVREVFQEEMKELLLEAIRSPKPIITEQWVQPNQQQFQPFNTGSPIPSRSSTTSITPEFKQNMRASYADILNETANSLKSSGENRPFVASPSTDSINGELPEGELNMDQILNIMGKR